MIIKLTQEERKQALNDAVSDEVKHLIRLEAEKQVKKELEKITYARIRKLTSEHLIEKHLEKAMNDFVSDSLYRNFKKQHDGRGTLVGLNGRHVLSDEIKNKIMDKYVDYLKDTAETIDMKKLEKELKEELLKKLVSN